MTKEEQELKPGQNTGFLPEPPSDTDYFSGHPSTKIVYQILNPSMDWSDYLPSDENQSGGGGDAFNCVSQSLTNSLETQLNFLLAKGLLPEYLENWLRAKGYIDENNKANFSERKISKESNTTLRGNTFQKVWDAARHSGLLPEKDWTWDWNKKFVWNEYYAEIPQALKDKALEFLKYFNIQYEWVRTMDSVGQPISYTQVDKELKQAPLQIGHAVCSPWNTTAIIQACSIAPSHATELYDIQKEYLDDFDSYAPYRKRLAPNYAIPYILKGLLSVRTYEIHIDQVRFVWLKRKDIRDAFPATNSFYQDPEKTYSLYQWVKDYGTYEEPGIFQDKVMDWNSLGVSAEEKAEAEKIEITDDNSKKKMTKIIWLVKLFIGYLNSVWNWKN